MGEDSAWQACSYKGIGTLAGALAKAQSEIHHAKEEAVNPHFKSSYATLASIWNACRAALTKNELAVAQLAESEGSKVSVTTILLHSSGEEIRSTLTLTARDATPQSLGSAITYGRRYGLAAMVGVAPADDDGEAAQPSRDAPPDYEPSPVPFEGPPAHLNTPEPPVETFRIQNDAHKDRMIKMLEANNVPFRYWDDIGAALNGKPMNLLEFQKAVQKVTK